MTRVLTLKRAGPQATVQDLGRPGYMAEGLSRGGAADRLALAEGAALLGQKPGLAAIEFAGAGGEVTVSETTRIALTGAPMRASLGDRTLAWNASHKIEPGEILRIGAAASGVYGYLSVAGGIDTPEFLGSRSAHLVARIGARLSDGAELPLGRDPAPERSDMRILAEDRFRGDTVRVVSGAQTAQYDADTQARFEATAFTRARRGNRQGVAFDFDGAPFASKGQRTILSEPIVPGDIQMTGDGVPFVLLPECQTTGGYPRIGSVLPADLPKIAQAAPGARVRFRFLSAEEAAKAARPEAQRFADLAGAVQPLVRDPRTIRDLLSYQLVSGAITGDEDSMEERGA